MSYVANLINELPSTATFDAKVPKEDLVTALRALGVHTQDVTCQAGLRVSTAHLTLPAGTMVRELRSVSEDLALRLQAQSVRVSTNQLPGKVTLEVAHSLKEQPRVSLGDALKAVSTEGIALPWAMGLYANGEPAVFDLADAPHVLIGGQTGSGKSSHLHALVMSLALTCSPEDVELIFIDPKRVDLTQFQDLPHVKRNVLTTLAETTALVQELRQECEFRYEEFAHAEVTDIAAYNAWAAATAGEEPLPRMVVIIDELAMLMSGKVGVELAEALTQLAQTCRAAGIHLVLATQRPSALTMPTQLRSQLTTRVACRMSNATDSRMVLDATGAEKLLGAGDTLTRWGGASPERIQGAYVSPTWREWLITECLWAWEQESNDPEGGPSQEAAGQG